MARRMRPPGFRPGPPLPPSLPRSSIKLGALFYNEPLDIEAERVKELHKIYAKGTGHIYCIKALFRWRDGMAPPVVARVDDAAPPSTKDQHAASSPKNGSEVRDDSSSESSDDSENEKHPVNDKDRVAGVVDPDPSRVVVEAFRIFSPSIMKLLESSIPSRQYFDRHGNDKVLFKRPFKPLIRHLKDLRENLQKEEDRL